MGQNAKVCVTLIFNGRWLFDGVGWVYSCETEWKNVIIEEGIDFASLNQLLRLKVGHDCSYEDWRLSYMPKGEEAGHPITIGDDDDLEAFKFLNSKSQEHAADKGFGTGDKNILEGDRCEGLDVIHLGDTDSSSDDTVKCQGDMYKGLDVISISSQEEEEDMYKYLIV